VRELPHEPELAHTTHGQYLVIGGVPWGAIIAGSLTAISLLALSSSLAIAVDIPAYRGGVYGWGAGIWGVISAIVAFFLGGMIAGVIPPRERVGGHLRGLLVWVLAVPLIILLSTSTLGFLRATLAGNVTQMAVQPGAEPTLATQMGAAWGAFLGMLLGLFASVIGGGVGTACTCDKSSMKTS
jgi:hypothetical protein